MTVPTWKILDRGEVPDSAPEIAFACPRCEHEALLPVKGTPLAQLADGIVFDNDAHNAVPRVIFCRRCRRQFEVA